MTDSSNTDAKSAADPSAKSGTATTSSDNGSAGDSQTEPMRDTHFDFQHKVFSLPGAFFCSDPTSKDPVLNILLGDLKAALAFPTLLESFQIEQGSHDERLLEIVEQGLAYVKQIRPGNRSPESCWMAGRPGRLTTGTAASPRAA